MWLFGKSSKSQYNEEIATYIENLKKWNTVENQLFSKIDIKIVPFSCVKDGEFDDSGKCQNQTESLKMEKMTNSSIIDPRVKFAINQRFRDEEGQLQFLHKIDENKLDG